MKPIRIPYDSFVLASVVEELADFVGGKVQEIRQPSESEVVLSIYAKGSEAILLLSCHPVFFRAHFVTKRPSTLSSPPQFLTALRSRVHGARIALVSQVEGDRILDIVLEAGESSFRLVAELMGKHSNLMLLDEDGKVVGAAKWIGRSKSSRPIQPNARYELPPVAAAA